MIDAVSPVSGVSRVARSRLAREGALIFYWDLGGYQRIYIMPHSGYWLVIVSPYEAGGGLRRARGRRGCAGECAINCCHHHQTWPNRAHPNRDKCAVRQRQKSWKQESYSRWRLRARRVQRGSKRFRIAAHRQNRRSMVHLAIDHVSRRARTQSCAKSGNVLCCAGEGLCHAGNLPSTRNRCLRRQAC